MSTADIAFEVFLAMTCRERMSPDEQRIYDYHVTRQQHPGTTPDIEDQIRVYGRRKRAA